MWRWARWEGGEAREVSRDAGGRRQVSAAAAAVAAEAGDRLALSAASSCTRGESEREREHNDERT